MNANKIALIKNELECNHQGPCYDVQCNVYKDTFIEFVDINYFESIESLNVNDGSVKTGDQIKIAGEFVQFNIIQVLPTQYDQDGTCTIPEYISVMCPDMISHAILECVTNAYAINTQDPILTKYILELYEECPQDTINTIYRMCLNENKIP